MTWYVTVGEAEPRAAEGLQDIESAVRSVPNGESEFFVVEPVPDSEDSFVQASVWTEGIALGTSYVAEVRMPSGRGFRQWRLRTKRFEDIESAVLAYMDGEAPSGAPWVDVTDEFTDS